MAPLKSGYQRRRYAFDEVIRLPSSMSEIGKIRDRVATRLEQLGYAPRLTMNISLALEEAMANAIDHGSLMGQPVIEVGMTVSESCCILQVTDFGGITFNPEYFEKLAEVKDWGKGGRGIFLIKRLMDEVYYFFHPEKSTSVVMIKYREASAQTRIG
ncbi:MAG TPA: ATP-binding protein [Candidatus Ozemobacteraceae bacterium]